MRSARWWCSDTHTRAQGLILSLRPRALLARTLALIMCAPHRTHQHINGCICVYVFVYTWRTRAHTHTHSHEMCVDTIRFLVNKSTLAFCKALRARPPIILHTFEVEHRAFCGGAHEPWGGSTSNKDHDHRQISIKQESV